MHFHDETFIFVKSVEMNLCKVNKSSDIGLEPVREFNLYGKIQVLLLFRYKVSIINYQFLAFEVLYDTWY